MSYGVRYIELFLMEHQPYLYPPEYVFERQGLTNGLINTICSPFRGFPDPVRPKNPKQTGMTRLRHTDTDAGTNTDTMGRHDTTRHDTTRRTEKEQIALFHTLKPERPLLSRIQLHFPLRFTKPQLQFLTLTLNFSSLQS